MMLTLQVVRTYTERDRHVCVLQVTSGPPDEHGWRATPAQFIELVSDGPAAAGSFGSGHTVLVPIET